MSEIPEDLQEWHVRTQSPEEAWGGASVRKLIERIAALTAERDALAEECKESADEVQRLLRLLDAMQQERDALKARVERLTFRLTSALTVL